MQNKCTMTTSLIPSDVHHSASWNSQVVSMNPSRDLTIPGTYHKSEFSPQLSVTEMTSSLLNQRPPVISKMQRLAANDQEVIQLKSIPGYKMNAGLPVMPRSKKREETKKETTMFCRCTLYHFEKKTLMDDVNFTFAMLLKPCQVAETLSAFSNVLI